MTKTIDYSKAFDKQLKKAPIFIKVAFRKRLELFLKEPSHKSLRYHQLKGTLKMYHSINVTGDWRALFLIRTEENKETLVFEMLGTHSQLYR